MEFPEIVRGLERLRIHLFDVAYYAHGQVHTHRFVPCNRCNDSFSVTKVFVMTAVGLLFDQGKLEVTAPLGRYLSFPPKADPGWRLATVEHALTHRLGFDDGFLDIDQEDATRYGTDDYLSLVLSHPLKYMPGSAYVYSDAAFYLLSRLVAAVSGQGVDQLLWERLFQPMGFREAAWSRCPQGYPIGATGLYLHTADMLKVGILYLLDGVYENGRYLSRKWVKMALSREYEFQVMTPNNLIGKGGLYGQALAFSRDKGFAFACHAHEEQDVMKLIQYLDTI